MLTSIALSEKSRIVVSIFWFLKVKLDLTGQTAQSSGKIALVIICYRGCLYTN